MIDETKIRLMTKAEMLRKKDRRATVTAGSFFGSDYVAFQVIKGVLGVIIVFALVLGGAFLVNAEELLTGYSLDELYTLLRVVIILFLAILVVTIILSVLVYTSSYWRAREGRSEYRACLRKLEKYYNNQEQEQSGT